MKLSQPLRWSVRRIYALSIAQNALFSVPILVVYVRQYGVSFADFLLLQSFYAFATLFFEIPTGYLSDRWQRRRILTLATLSSFVGTLLYGMGTQYWYFVCAEMCLALGSSLQSGTIESLLHETMLEAKAESCSRSAIRHLFSLQLLTQATAAILSGFFAMWDLRMAVVAGLPFLFAAVILSFTLHEPRRIRMSEHNHARALWNVYSRMVLRRTEIVGVILLHSVIGTLTLCLLWFTQPYQEAIQLPLQLFGISQALILLGGVGAAWVMGRVEHRWDDRILLMFVSATVIISYLLLSSSVSGIGMLFLFTGRSVYGALMPLTTDLLNQMVSSDIRATVLSIRAFAMRLLFACTAPFMGFATEVFTLTKTIKLTGIIGGIGLFSILYSMRGVWKKIPQLGERVYDSK